MSHAALSVLVYGIYALAAGAGFLFIPNVILDFLGFLGLETTTEHWVRIVAILTAGIGYYYVSSARAEARHFFRISAIGRVWFFLASSTLSAVGIAPTGFVLFGAVDLVTAVWTMAALRRDAQGARPPT